MAETPSPWTFATLLKVVEQKIDDLEKLLDERYRTQTKATDAAFVAQQTAMKTAFDAADKAVQAALAAAEKASIKAERAADDRFRAANEFREQQKDIIAGFIPRMEYDVAHRAVIAQATLLSDRLNALELRLTSRLDLGQGAEDGKDKRVGEQRSASALTAQWIVLAILAIGLVVTILVAVL